MPACCTRQGCSSSLTRFIILHFNCQYWQLWRSHTPNDTKSVYAFSKQNKPPHMFNDLKIGILGGGQLGAMLLRYAIDYGLQVAFLDTSASAPCARYSNNYQVGDPLSYDDVLRFGKGLDIISIEKEAVNIEALKTLRERGVRVYPEPETIAIIQDKFAQKEFLREHGFPVVSGWLVADKASLAEHTTRFPAVLKQCKGGYDGKGVIVVKTLEDVPGGFNGPYVLEELVDIHDELSVIVSRNEAGVIECYDPVTMIFDKERMLLDFQVCPAGLSEDVALRVCALAARIAEAINLTGIMAVEMFVGGNGKVYVNELAPRPHNSGHHTIEAAATSQFEQQLRVMLGLPLGSARTTSPSVMMNILEPAAHRKHIIMEALKTLLCTNDVHLHWYGKGGGVEGRKMGHITITDVSREEAISKAIMIRHLLKENV
ncbi:MAG: 5-(carboxyamino)imidazole ribonucleotide synthase [Chitinophagia bacterium]|nr:5-(carboxyamino)imidazole ribonucleotide synthase [Chitinophagia bacterium]